MNLYFPRQGHRQTITLPQAADLLGQPAARKLTLFRLRYHLEGYHGFSRDQANHLLFIRYLAFDGMSDVPLPLGRHAPQARQTP